MSNNDVNLVSLTLFPSTVHIWSPTWSSFKAVTFNLFFPLTSCPWSSTPVCLSLPLLFSVSFPLYRASSKDRPRHGTPQRKMRTGWRTVTETSLHVCRDNDLNSVSLSAGSFAVERRSVGHRFQRAAYVIALLIRFDSFWKRCLKVKFLTQDDTCVCLATHVPLWCQWHLWK